MAHAMCQPQELPTALGSKYEVYATVDILGLSSLKLSGRIRRRWHEGSSREPQAADSHGMDL